MDKNNQINELLQKRMDRKDFLKHVGIGMLALTGLSGVFKLLQNQKVSGGYGSSTYGGAQRKNTAYTAPKRSA